MCGAHIAFAMASIVFLLQRVGMTSFQLFILGGAPEVVVYDFACALQPYCMLREPNFFSKTLFVIDAFHAKGHTRCSHSAFLKMYHETIPVLTAVNSSATECGNSGILRIRKSVSYISQERAVIYTKTFLSLWNRRRIQKLEKVTLNTKH